MDVGCPAPHAFGQEGRGVQYAHALSQCALASVPACQGGCRACGYSKLVSTGAPHLVPSHALRVCTGAHGEGVHDERVHTGQCFPWALPTGGQHRPVLGPVRQGTALPDAKGCGSAPAADPLAGSLLQKGMQCLMAMTGGRSCWQLQLLLPRALAPMFSTRCSGHCG